MTTLSQFGVSRPTKSIVSVYSSGTPAGVACGAVGQLEVLSGAVTANTLKTLLTISSAGEMTQLSAYTKDTTSRTVRCQVTVDGTVVFNSTTAAITTSGSGIIVTGRRSDATFESVFPTIRFNSSLVVEVASSLSETDKVAIGYVTQTF
jgi:hypothetical protein